MQTKSTDQLEELAEFLRQPENGYRAVRVLQDGAIIAVGDLIYTRAIFIDCDRWGYSRRYCFQNRSLADIEFEKLNTSDEEPTGFIARRPD